MTRYDKLIKALADKAIDSAIIMKPENMRYISGFTGEGCLFVSKDAKVIITDFRYTEQAERQSPGWRIEMTGAGRALSAIVSELYSEYGCTGTATETDHVVYDIYKTLSDALGTDIGSISGMIEDQRAVKDEDEIASIREAARISCRAFDNLLKFVKPGMTEKEVQIALDYEMLKLGSEGNAFSTIAAAGVNGSLPHAVPSDHVIKNGELLTLDFGAKVNGYDADMTRTIGFGKIDGELRKIYDLVLEAQLAALDYVAPGRVCRDIDKVARDMLDREYPGRFGHSLGHGVGLFIHEMPAVSYRSDTVLVPGHVITIEPGLYIPGLGGCRIEDMAIITADGYIDPIDAPKQLIEL